MHALLRRARLCCAIVAVATAIARAETSDTPPPPPTAAERLEKILDSPGSFEFTDTPLGDVIEQIAEQHGITTLLDTKELEQAGIGPETTISLSLKSNRLATLLTRMLAPHNLAYETADGVLTITTSDRARNSMNVRVYDVVDLIRRESGDPADEWDHKPLVDLVTNVVAPDSWDQNGGQGTLSYYDGMLAISQTVFEQTSIRRLLDDLRAVRQAQLEGREVHSRGVGLTAQGEALRRALDEPTSVELNDTPLGDFAAQIADQHGLSVDLDLASLEQAGIGPETPITFHIRGVPLRVALARALTPLGAAFCLKDDVLLITTFDTSCAELNTVIYPVADLLRPADPSEPDVLDYGSLIETLINTCSPDSWDKNGGKGIVGPFALAKVLVIAQTDNVHREIERLLVDLRGVRGGRPEQMLRTANAGEPVVEVYRISDLAYTFKESADRSAQSAEEVAQLIGKWIESPDWTADENTVHVVGSRVVIKAPPQVQRQVKKLIDKLGLDPTRGGCVGCLVGGGMGGMGVGGHGGGMFNVAPTEPVEPSTPNRLPR